MARRSLPGLGLTGGYSSGDDGWTDEMNDNLLTMSVVSQLVVESMSSALPGSPTNGMIYIVPTAGETQWKLAVRENGAWVYLTPGIGWTAWVKSPGKSVRWDGSAWADVVGAGGTIAVKDEGSTTVAAAGALNFVGTGVSVADAGSGVATVTIDGGGGGGSSLEGPLTAPPAAATFIQQNFDATKTHLADVTSPVTGVRIYEDAYAYGNVNTVRYALQAIPGTKWDLKVRLRRHTKVCNFMSWGIVLRDSASGKSMIWGFNKEAGGLGFLKMTNDTTYSAWTGLGGAEFPYATDIWLRLRYDDDYTFQMSSDGVWWRTMSKGVGSALWGFLTNPATHVGFGYNANNAGDGAIGQEVDLLSWSLVSLP